MEAQLQLQLGDHHGQMLLTHSQQADQQEKQGFIQAGSQLLSPEFKDTVPLTHTNTAKRL